jgi:hypothetical protein
MPYLATKPGTAFRTFTDKDTFSGDGSTTVFDMQFAIAEAGQNDLQIFVAGALKIPGTDFTLGVDAAGDYKRITFTSAPANGSNNIVVLNPGTVEGELATVADNSITSGKVNVDVITGQTELAEAAANNDTLLLHDTSAGALKKIQVSNLTAQAGDGLAKTNSTLAVDIPNTTLLNEGAASNDELLIYDTSATALRSITQTNLLNFPVVSSVSPTNVLSGDGTGNHTIVITGTGFLGATANLINDSGTAVNFDSQTVDSATQITGVIAKSSLPDSGEPYDVKVVASTGLANTLANQININAQPAFSTAAGSLGSIADGARSGASFTILAADPESGGDVVYTLESGSLPANMSLASQSSGAVISGTPNAVGSDTTSTFTIRAKDVNSNTSDRQFTITILAPAYNSFTSSGTFSVPTGLTSVDVLVVAGGGAGGSDNGGGGGAGGLIYRPGFTVTPGATMPVTVGDGGPAPGGNNHAVAPGQDSVFGTLTAKGGGGGSGQSGAAGGPGGAGGGGNGHGTSGPAQGAGGSAIQPNQSGESGNYGFGNVGGTGNSAGGHAGAGGGGAGSQGSDGNGGSATGGQGGNGRAYTIADGTTSVYYGGGGGGGSNGGTGGQGQNGGGQGAQNAGGGAQNNTGSGGGGGGNANPRPGGAGGKGIVIVKY